jgi:MFS family permease
MAITAEAVAAQPRADRNPFAGAQYCWWWGMTFCASVAVGLQLVSVPAYVLDRTDTRFYVALALLCQTVPTALLTLLGGATADRTARRRILLTTLAVAATTSVAYLALSLGDVRAIWPVFLIAAVVGATTAFQGPARSALVRMLAPGARLQNGVIFSTLAFMGGSQFIGPAIAGPTIRAFDLTAAFALEAVLLAAAWLCATRLRGIDDGLAPPSTGLAEQVKEGARYVRSEARMWQLMLLSAVPGMFFMGVSQAVFPVFARDTFNGGADAQSLLNGGMGLGVLGGSLLLTRWGPRQRRGRWIIAGLPYSGAMMVLTGLAPSLQVAAALLLFSGLGAAVFINYSSTLLQTYAEPRLIGRVMSLWSLCFMAAVPVGNLYAGIGIQFSDPRAVLVGSGLVSAALGVVAFSTLRAARSLD